jgi:hypothetical protein
MSSATEKTDMQAQLPSHHSTLDYKYLLHTLAAAIAATSAADAASLESSGTHPSFTAFAAHNVH